MFPRLLSEADVLERLTMPVAIEAVESAFRHWAAGEADNTPRARAKAGKSWLHTLSAAVVPLNLMGWKAYSTTPQGARFHVGVYALDSGEPLALIEANHLGQIRTGAATGVATRLLSRPDASRVGLFGTGFQARTQLEAVCCVRPVRQITVFSRDPGRRRTFAEEMSRKLNVDVIPATAPELAVRDCDLIVTATSARQPVFDGQWLGPGTHINAVGSNQLNKAEVDPLTVHRARRVICDSIDQCRLEAGELYLAEKQGQFAWSSAVELREILVGREEGRTTDSEITLFKSVGIGLEDVAMAALVL